MLCCVCVCVCVCAGRGGKLLSFYGVVFFFFLNKIKMCENHQTESLYVVLLHTYFTVIPCSNTSIMIIITSSPRHFWLYR